MAKFYSPKGLSVYQRENGKVIDGVYTFIGGKRSELKRTFKHNGPWEADHNAFRHLTPEILAFGVMMYQKHEKPCVWFKHSYGEYYTHLGEEQFFAWKDYEGYTLSFKHIGNKCWHVTGNEYLFEESVFVLSYPLMKWSEEE